MPGAVEIIEPGLAEQLRIDPVIGQHAVQVLPVQDVEPGPGTAASAAFLHRRLVAAAPGIGEGARVDVAAAELRQHRRRIARHALAPVDDRTEDVENESLYVFEHHFVSCAHLASNSQTSGKPISSVMRLKP